MIIKIQSTFALKEQGAKDFVKSALWSGVANLTLMFPIGLILIVLQTLLDEFRSGSATSTKEIVFFTVVAALLVLLIFIVHYIQYASLYITTYAESANRRIRLAEKLRQLPLSFFGQRDLSDLTSTLISDCASLEQMFSHYVPQLFGSLISIVMVAIGMFVFDWRMALSVLWVLPVAFLLTVGTKALQDKFGKRNITAKRIVADGVQECLETVRELKSNNMQEAYLNQLDEKLRNAEKSAIRSELATGTFVSTAQAFLRLGLASTVLIGGNLLIRGETDFLTYFVFLLAASRLYDPLSLVMMNIGAMFAAKLQIDRMKELESQPVQTGSTICNPENYNISFENVSFSYSSGEQVLNDVTFTAKQGEVTALVGPSGSGKSTIAKLAARFWDVDSGKITLGGIDIFTVDPETLLSNYSIVFQDVVLFHDSIMENIRLGKRGASNGEVLAAAKAARCDEFVSKLPEGYDTVIGENGATLSGGERQRISIARALLKDAPIILLDEATASLDADSETKVQKALSQLIQNKTVLVIAHRMRTVAGADKVVVLENGHLADIGSPDDLQKKDGLYKNMVERQLESTSWKL